MRSISAEALASFADVHGVFATALVVNRAGTTLTSIDVGEDALLTLDSTALVRRHVSFSAPDYFNQYLPVAGSVLDPSKVNLLKVRAGVQYITGYAGTVVTEDWPVGTFLITDPRLDDTGGQSLSVDGYDLAALVSMYRLKQPYSVVAGTNVATAIAALIDFVVPAPTLPKSFSSTSAVMPAGIVLAENDDAMVEAAKWAAGIGMDLFFDATGTLILRPTPDPYSSAAVKVYNEGSASIIKRISQTFSVTDSRSHIIALGTAIDGSTPLRADSFDTTPTSPTYYLGAFGDVADTLNVSTATTLTDLQAAADGELARRRGLSRIVEFASVPLSAHDEQDVILIQRAASDLNDRFIMESMTIPLAWAGEQTNRCNGRLL